MTDLDWSSFIDAGLYTVPIAAKILATRPEKVRSWVEGYPNSKAKPILVRQVPRIADRPVLGFLDLIESAFVRNFRDIGYSPQTIRKVAVKLRDKYENDHPFAMNQRFRADGKRIFEEVVTDEGERSLLDIMSDNFVMVPAVEQTLFDQVFYFNDLASEWNPIREFPGVIMNPKMSFGRPILKGSRIPTETVARRFLIEDDYQTVADEFGIDQDSVISAVAFEKELEGRTLH